MSNLPTDESEEVESGENDKAAKLREKIGDGLKEVQDTLPKHPDHPDYGKAFTPHTAYDKDRFDQPKQVEPPFNDIDFFNSTDWTRLNASKTHPAPDGSGFGFAPNALDKLRLALIDAREQKEAAQNAGNGKLARHWAVCITEMEGTEARMVYFLELDTPH